MWPAIIGAVASLAGSLIANKGAKERNEAQIVQADDTNQFNAEQAALQRQWTEGQTANAMNFSASQAQNQMAFQRDMSSTSWQRAIADMSAAGLNPMLAYQQGGASSPSGSAGSGMVGGGASASGVMPQLENELASFGNGAGLAGAMSAAQIERLAAETDKIRAETVTEQRRGDVMHYEIRNKIEEIYGRMANTDLTREEIRKVKEEIALTVQRTDIATAEAFLTKLEMLVKEAQSESEVYKAIADAKAWASEYGQNWRPYVRDVGSGAEAFRDLMSGARSGIGRGGSSAGSVRGGQGLRPPSGDSGLRMRRPGEARGTPGTLRGGY